MNGYGFSGQSSGADPWSYKSHSAASKMEHTFWVTKQSVFRKLGKKDDECVVASDAELDAKLELFRSVQDTCQELERILDRYLERLCNLSQEESAMGRFLKEVSKRDQTNAGKAMASVGKALSYSGQQRLALRVPLHRLYQEVDTFRQRAIEDTLLNVSAMERQRTEYRAALSWMKNVSQELDPDTFKQLERFRRVQGQVRHSKANFDKLKLDCLQKVDLLAAARCNMFSHALTLYQTALIQHARRAHRAYTIVAKDLKGYQHYEFMVVPELTEESSRLAKQTKEATSEVDKKEEDKEELLFFDTDYYDKDYGVEGATPVLETCKSDSLQNLLNNGGDQSLPPLLPIESSNNDDKRDDGSEIDLLASECFGQLDSILSKSPTEGISSSGDVCEDWSALFSSNGLENLGTATTSKESFDPNSSSQVFLPSELLDQITASLNLNPSSQSNTKQDEGTESVKKLSAGDTTGTSNLNFVSGLLSQMRSSQPVDSSTVNPDLCWPGPSGLPSTMQGNVSSASSQALNKTSNEKKKDMSAWYDLFADLDPLANPDALESKLQEEERNC